MCRADCSYGKQTSARRVATSPRRHRCKTGPPSRHRSGYNAPSSRTTCSAMHSRGRGIPCRSGTNARGRSARAEISPRYRGYRPPAPTDLAVVISQRGHHRHGAEERRIFVHERREWLHAIPHTRSAGFVETVELLACDEEHVRLVAPQRREIGTCPPFTGPLRDVVSGQSAIA